MNKNNRKRRMERIQRKLEEEDEPEDEPVVISAVEYARRKREADIFKSSRFQKCHICRQAIPIDEISEHMRVELLNPKEKSHENQRRTAIESSDRICDNLATFAANRVDVFVGKNEPTPIIDRDYKPNAGKLPPTPPPPAASAGAGSAGAGGGSSGGKGEIQIMLSQPARLLEVNSHLPPSDVESLLMPEKLFLMRHPGPLTLKVQVPKEAQSPYNLKGQGVGLSFFGCSDKVGELKEKLKNALGGLPTPRMLLLANTPQGPLPLKDDKKSLAYYNLRKGAVLDLRVLAR